MSPLEIHKDCANAVSKCPQCKTHHVLSIEWMERTKIGIEHIPTVHYWAFCNTLWKAGYYIYLSEQTKEEMNKYVASLGWKALLYQ